MKKLLFLVTALLAMVQQSSAQTTPVVTVADVEALPGETVAFSLNLTGGKVNKYTALQFDVQFPATGFSTTGAYTVNPIWIGVSATIGNVDASGVATAPFASANEIPAADVENLVSVSFTVDNALPIGDYDVTLKNLWFGYNMTDKDYLENVTFKVKVVERHTVVLNETDTQVPADATGVDVTVKRTINANEWSTLCLPFAMTKEQVTAAFGSGVELADFTSWSSEEDDDGDIISIEVGFDDVDAIEANHPYIIKVSSAIEEFNVENVDIEAEEEPTVQVGKKKAEKGFFTGTYTANTVVPEDNLFLSGNDFWYSTGKTKMKAFRGFFEFADVLTDKEASSSRIMMSFDEETTDMKHVTFNMKQDMGEWYTLDGRKLGKKPTAKGVYVKDGRKVVIK